MNDPIATSKYCDLNSKIEFFSKIFYTALVKITMPGIILPAFLLTINDYYFHDLGDDSYGLPYPIVYVSVMSVNTYLIELIYFHFIDYHSIGKHPMDIQWLYFLNRL